MNRFTPAEFNDSHQDEIDLLEILNILLKGKWIFCFVTSFITIIGLTYSLLVPNLYESKALLVPTQSSNSFSRNLDSYSAIASLSGLSLPNGNSDDNSKKALKKIVSLSFFENNLLKNIHLPELMAFKSWNPITNKTSFNESIYDITSNTWNRDYSYPKTQIPSAQESFEVFKSKHLILSEDNKSGFIALSIKHQSPYIAKEWAELVVDEINSYYREKDKTESEAAVNYLKKQISITNFSEIKTVLAQLLQEETKKLALIEANKFYVFDYIDPPAVMEKKTEPRRSIILIISMMLGVTLSIFIIFARHFISSRRV